MEDKVIVIAASNYCKDIESRINEEFQNGYRPRSFYKIKDKDNEKLIVLLVRKKETK